MVFLRVSASAAPYPVNADAILRWNSVFQLIHLRRAGALSIGGLVLLTGLYAWQKPFREYPGLEYTKYPIPPNPNEPTEWVFARLMYPPVPPRNGGVELFDSWKEGGSNWTMDYPRSDRHLSAAVRRLTRIHARSAEEPTDLDDGDVFNRPWLYGVEVGHWDADRFPGGDHARIPAARRLLHVRRFPRHRGVVLLRSQHAQSLPRPSDRRDPKRRPHLPHASTTWTSATRCPASSTWIPARSGRKMAKCPTGAAFTTTRAASWWPCASTWTWAIPGSTPTIREYPAHFSDLGIRLGVNYIVYAMTH